MVLAVPTTIIDWICTEAPHFRIHVSAAGDVDLPRQSGHHGLGAFSHLDRGDRCTPEPIACIYIGTSIHKACFGVSDYAGRCT